MARCVATTAPPKTKTVIARKKAIIDREAQRLYVVPLEALVAKTLCRRHRERRASVLYRQMKAVATLSTCSRKGKLRGTILAMAAKVHQQQGNPLA
jgi:hypothetical protein